MRGAPAWSLANEIDARELILTSVGPDEKVAVRGVEHHTLVCSVCQIVD
jgi:hypothetical protein